MATNSFGLDAAYFSDKLSLVLRDLSHFTPEELARALARMARTACEGVLGEAEFTVQAAPTCAAQDGDAQLDAMRRSGLSIDGDNAYKRDLIDCIVGALMLGKQGVNPPPAGHWLEQFWQMARGEGEIQERMAERVLAPNDGERKTLAERMRDKFHCAEITPEIVRKLKGEEKSVMDMIASSPDGKGSQEMHDALDVLHSYLLMCRLEDPVMAPRELLEELRAFTLEYDSGRAGVLRGGIDALLREEGEQ